MRFVRTGSVFGIAAILTTGWMFVQPAGWPASSPASVTYYVSPAGSDLAAGTSPSTAWRTLARASAATLRPGYRLLLQGSHQYAGQLDIGPADGGSAASPVLISSYGTGRAIITSATSAVVIYDTGGITISNLTITGQHAMAPGKAGIQVFSDLSGRMLSGVSITGVNVSGFGQGIDIGALHDSAGFGGVRISSSVLHGNLDAGLATYGPAFNAAAPGYANANIYISHVVAFGNRGDPADTTANSGSGIVLGSVRHATVTRSVAYFNGGAGAAPTQGPVGIWAYDSTGVVVEHDVSHDNWSASKQDGGGFGLDQNTSNSVLEYDLSYRNHGPGFLLYAAPRNSSQSGNVIRFNISYGDSRGYFALGGLAVGGRVKNAAVYQNTVVMARTGSQATLKVSGPLQGVRVLNNIFVASSAGPLVLAINPMTRSQVVLAGNDYWAPAGQWTVTWGTVLYHSLRAWRAATGQERLGTRLTGLVLPPLFAGPLSGQHGGAGFALQPRSRLRQAGLNLRLLFGLRAGPVYYSGRPYPVSTPDVGAQ